MGIKASKLNGCFAVLSIGTNSTRMLLADLRATPPHIEAARTIGTRIGEGLGERGRLGDEPMKRTLDALRDLLGDIHGRYQRLVVISTSALRRAENGEEFAQRVKDLTGEPLRIVSGEEEAAASYRGATTMTEIANGTHAGVVDIGGGSTEYATGEGVTPHFTHSYEIGAVRLTETFPALNGSAAPAGNDVVNQARAFARSVLFAVREAPHVEQVLFVGGSATTTAAMLRIADPSTTANGTSFSRAALAQLFNRLCAIDLEARKQLPGMRPQRADILPAGIILIDSVLELLGHERATVAKADLLLGVLLQEHERLQREPR